jgi:hypothetical protein
VAGKSGRCAFIFFGTCGAFSAVTDFGAWGSNGGKGLGKCAECAPIASHALSL